MLDPLFLKYKRLLWIVQISNSQKGVEPPDFRCGNAPCADVMAAKNSSCFLPKLWASIEVMTTFWTSPTMCEVATTARGPADVSAPEESSGFAPVDTTIFELVDAGAGNLAAAWPPAGEISPTAAWEGIKKRVRRILPKSFSLLSAAKFSASSDSETVPNSGKKICLQIRPVNWLWTNPIPEKSGKKDLITPKNVEKMT